MTTVAPKRIVVVGNGIAGLTSCDQLRANGFDGDLTIVGAERYKPYSRPALSKALLMDAADVTSHQLPEPAHGATELLGVSAIRLDVEHRVVWLDDGTDLSYDGLVIASGSRARRLGIEPPNGDNGQLTLRTLDDALALRERIAARPSVAVIGGGPLGMEIASSCLASGCAVTLVSDVPPLSAHLGAYLSEAFVETAIKRGLQLTVTGSAEVINPGGLPVVRLADGQTVRADVVVTAVGDIPNVEWLSNSGLLTNGRLEVDTRGRLAADIVAAGDVAAFPTSHGIRRAPFWTSAIDQSRAAATTLLRGDQAPEFEFKPYFWTEQFGLSLKACGQLPTDGAPRFIEGTDPTGPALMSWPAIDGSGTAVAINYRIPVPRMRRMAAQRPDSVDAGTRSVMAM